MRVFGVFIVLFFNAFSCWSEASSKSDDVEVTYQTTRPNFSKEEKVEYGDFDDIIKRGELVVCSVRDTSNTLFLMKKKGSENEKKLDLIGEDIELAKQIAKALGVKLVFRLCYESYDDVVNAIANGEGDIGISKLSYTIERSRKVMYTEPYVIAKKTLLMNRQIAESDQETSIRNLLNNKNFKIGVAKGASYAEFVHLLFPEIQVVELENFGEDAVQKLKNNDIIAAIRDNLRIHLLLNKHPELSLKFIPIFLKGENDYISGIVNYKSMKLLNFVNKLLKYEIGMKTMDELIKIYEAYVK